MKVSNEAGRSATHLKWVDHAKGLAILLVISYHTSSYLGLDNRLHGEIGVDVFLMLSGFTLALNDRRESQESFLRRRLLRLAPAYWLTLFLCLAADLLVFNTTVRPLDVLLHLFGLHLLAGDPFAFSINMSFWFIGLIVPLYLCFSLLRPSMRAANPLKGACVALAVACAVSAAMEFFSPTLFTIWGEGPVTHVAPRIPMFFLGMLGGLLWKRGDSPADVLREPFIVIALFVYCALPFWALLGPYARFGFGAAGVIAASFWISAGRSLVLTVVQRGLALLGVFSYELFLCHQYLLIDVNERVIIPLISDALPDIAPFLERLIGAMLALAAAPWLALAIFVAANPSRSAAWKVIPVAAILSLLLLVGAGIATWSAEPVARRFSAEVGLDVTSEGGDPIVYFGSRGAADIVIAESFCENVHCRTRIAIDHWGSAKDYSEWFDPAVLATRQDWTITIFPRRIVVTAGPIQLSSQHPAYAPDATPIWGLNDLGFSTARVNALAAIEPANQRELNQFSVRVAPAANLPERSDPVLYLGSRGAADLVLLEQICEGSECKARIGIDHWGAPIRFTEWVDPALLSKQDWIIAIFPRYILVRAGTIEIKSRHPAFAPDALPVWGRNDIGFSTAQPEAAATIEPRENQQ